MLVKIFEFSLFGELSLIWLYNEIPAWGGGIKKK